VAATTIEGILGIDQAAHHENKLLALAHNLEQTLASYADIFQ